MLNCFGPVRLFATLWTVAHQAPPSVGFSRQEYRSGVPSPPPGDLPNPGIKLASHTSPALADGFFSISTTWDLMSRMSPHKPGNGVLTSMWGRAWCLVRVKPKVGEGSGEKGGQRVSEGQSLEAERAG